MTHEPDPEVVPETSDAPGPVEPGWQRVHPVTPVVKGWKVLVAILVIVTQQLGQNFDAAGEAVRAVGWIVLAGAVVLVVAIGFVYSLIAWRMTRYAVDTEAVHLRKGILFRQQRTARLDRIQAIDVVQPLLARLFGLAELKIEVAGGSDSAVMLSFLREPQAQTLRNELLARAAGVEFGTAQTPEAPAAPEREVLAVTPQKILWSLVLSGAVLWGAVAVAAAVVGSVMMRSAAFALGLLPLLLGTVGYAWQRFNADFNFRAALSPDGIRLRHGLTSARAQTVPPGRVQAVRLVQPLLWRRRDWWRVQINVAGYGLADQATGSTLLPVGDRDEALLALWLVLPDLGAADPRALLDEALSGRDDERGFTTSPRRARWLDPLAWRRNGFTITDRALLVRSGRLVRAVAVVPHERTQSLGLAQGPLQRRLGLASVALHSTIGPVTPQVPHLDQLVAGRLLDDQAARARQARATAGPEQWMLELARVADDPETDEEPAVPEGPDPHVPAEGTEP